MPTLCVYVCGYSVCVFAQLPSSSLSLIEIAQDQNHAAMPHAPDPRRSYSIVDGRKIRSRHTRKHKEGESFHAFPPSCHAVAWPHFFSVQTSLCCGQGGFFIQSPGEMDFRSPPLSLLPPPLSGDIRQTVLKTPFFSTRRRVNERTEGGPWTGTGRIE